MHRDWVCRLQGFLSAMEALNRKNGSCVGFDLLELTSEGTALQALKEFNAPAGQPADDFEVRLVPITDWHAFATNLFRKWLFVHIDLNGWVPAALHADLRAATIGKAMDLLTKSVSASDPLRAYTVDVRVPEESPHDDFMWFGDHLVLETRMSRLYLHLSPSD